MRPDLVPIDHRGQPRAPRLVDRLHAYDRKLAAENARDDHPVRRHALDHRRRLGNLIQRRLLDGARGKLVTAGILPERIQVYQSTAMIAATALPRTPPLL